MIKNLNLKSITLTGALGILALFPANAQSSEEALSETARDAMEAAETVAAAAGSADIEEGAAPPQLTEFDLLQNKPADYPAASWVNGEEGTAYYELAVAADGTVTDCTIIDSAGYAALDAKTCEIAMERAEFLPAQDESGMPIAGTHRDYQVWRKREPQFPGSATIHVQFTATAEGSIEDCEVIEIAGEIGERMRRTMEDEPCPGMNRNSQPPYRDEEGNPVARRVDLMIVVKAEALPE